MAYQVRASMAVPVDIAKIIGHRQCAAALRSASDIAFRQAIPLLGKPVDIVQMNMKVRHRGAHHLRRRIAACRHALDIALIEERRSHLDHEFALEPVCQATDFGTLGRGAPYEAGFGVLGFLEIFGNDHGAAEDITILGDKDRHLARRIDRQEVFMTIPWCFHFRQIDKVPFARRSRTVREAP